MKRFLPSKQALQGVLIAACAVVFLFFINNILSKHSIFENIFSSKKIFVKTVDVSDRNNFDVQKKTNEDNKQLASFKKIAQKTEKEIVVITKIKQENELVSPSSSTKMAPRIYIQEIQTGDAVSAKNEFVKICNYGNEISMSGVSLKKKTSSGSEETLLNDQWENVMISSGGCIYVSNADAEISASSTVQWAKSHALAEKNNTLLLYFDGQVIDEVFWNIIPKGKSIIRESPTSSWHIKL